MKTYLSVVLVTFTALFNNGCKKGEGDSFISLKSRKARLTGEWTIDSWNYTIVNSYTNNSNYTFSSSGITTNASSEITGTQNYDLIINNSSFSIMDKISQKDVSISGGSLYNSTESTTKNGTASGTATIEFGEDGSFSRKIEYTNANFTVNSTIINNSGNSSFTNNTVETHIEIATGTWEFLGGIDGEFKNKERIILHIKSKVITKNQTDANGSQSSSTENIIYEDADNNEIWLLTTLKNKELVFEAEISMSSTYSSVDQTNTGQSNSSVLTTISDSGIGSIKGSLSK